MQIIEFYFCILIYTIKHYDSVHLIYLLFNDSI